MKRFLYLLICLLMPAIGVWAGPNDPYEIMPSETWNGSQQAVKIKINQAGSLSDAITAASTDGCSIVIIETKDNVSFNDADLSTLSSINFETIDLQNYKGDPFTFTNSNVKYVTLPASWTKAEVKALGQALSTSQTFEAALCQGEKNGEPFLTAYSNKAGSLENAIPHLAWAGPDGNLKPEYKIGTSFGNCSKLRVLTAMGKICAKDISRQGVFDTNGHYVINGVADENADPKTGKGLNTDGGQLYAGANASGAVEGAIKGCHEINVIDLSEAIIPDAYCTDIVPHYTGIQLTNLREIWMPEDPDFKTIPADYLNHSTAIHQICIPGNIETIKTRAFAGGGTRVNYIWTTGSDPSVRYDNGATFITNPGQADEVRTQKYKTEVGKDLNLTEEQTQYFNPAEEYPLFEAGDDNNFNYGTFTLPAGLKLIERFAFYTSTSVSDVYILNPVAPECHVDGFNSSQYHANNTVKAENIREETDEDGNKIKIITRDAYNNGINQPMAMLHYPQETATPNVQRFTDPTREYSIATGDRDGKGNMLYFPTQTEFEVAEWQGTFGYLWNAWNIDRTWYNQEIMLGRGQGWYGGDFQSDAGYDQNGQALANQFYLDNPNPNPTTGTDKTDRSFYDVTADGSLNQPAGLDWYYNSYRSGQQLYPQMETTETTEVIGERQSVDSNGDPIFEECSNGNYVKDFIYVPAENGEYVQVATVNGYQGTQTPVEGVSTYYSDNQGNNAVTPKVQNGYFFEDGVKNVYTQVDKNNDAIGAKSQYYTKSGDTYTESYLMFNQTYYYPTGNKIVVPKYVACNYTTYDPTKTYYIESNGVYTEVLPNFNGTTYYYENGEYKPTTVAIQDVTEYYQNYGGWTAVMPQITQYYYYADGTEEIDEWISSDHFISGKTWYKLENGTYQPKTLSWYDGIVGDYYYVSGTEANYSSADGQDYNASTTYYTSNTGETVVNPVNFNDTYYYPTYDYSYVDYTGQEGDRYTKKDSYREWTSTDGEVQRYCPVMEPVYATVKGTQYDYRGWHQFVLAGYGYNGVIPNEPIRSFISDNEWWTICEPYDLRYNDLIKFFGTDRAGFEKQIPYLSKLMYVIRDVENNKITLMFSKNLMVYKEVIADADHVHGTIDDVTTWIGEGEGQYADQAALEAANPVILHKGVPYLIKPNLTVDAQTGNITATRAFNVYKTDSPELYGRLNAASKLGAAAQANMIYDGEYTVPAYVVGLGKEGAGTEAIEEDGVLEIQNSDGSSFTYQNSAKSGKKLNYRGQEVDYEISAAFKYTFIGSLYKSLMPQYCYFLGWDSKNNCAAFWYSAVQDKTGWNWNNQTGIICPNFPTNTKISSATGFNDPARWKIADKNGTILQPDDITMPSGGSGAKSYTMDFGATNFFDIEEELGVATVINGLPQQIQGMETDAIYSLNGIYMGTSTSGLAKGVYIKNGKKLVVK